MNKSELIEAMAESANLSKVDTKRALDAFTASVMNAMSAGDSVQLTGFGSFVVRKRAARAGRNPATGATIQLAATKIPAFKAGKSLKDAVS